MSRSVMVNLFDGFARKIILCICLLVLTSRPVWAEASLEAGIDAMVSSTMQRGHVPGMSVLVARGDKILLEKGYGQADVEQSTPVTADTVFAIGSVTKQFTGLAIAQLVAAGKVSLDDSIRKYVSGLPNSYEKIRIRNLLNHTSGIYNYTRNGKLHELSAKRHSHEEMLAWFVRKPLAFRPGEKWSYTNSGVYLLGMVIEKASGMSYAEYVAKNIFEPFGMAHSYYGDSRTIIPQRARGYDYTDGNLVNAQSYDASIPFSAGTLLATSSDLWKYARNVHKGSLVSGDVRKVIYTTEFLGGGEKISYSLGCFGISEFHGHLKYSHAGEIYGYFSQLAYYPQDDLTIVVLSNRKGYFPTPVSLERRIARLALGLPQSQNDKVALEHEYEGIGGAYDLGSVMYFADDKFTLRVSGENIYLSFGLSGGHDSEIPFFYVGNGRFVSYLDDEIAINIKLDKRNISGSLEAFDSKYYFKKL